MDYPIPQIGSWWAGRRVALTGATGFLGHHVSVALVNAGARITALIRPTSDISRLDSMGVPCTVAPLTDSLALEKSFQNQDLVLHLAASVDFNDDRARFQDTNVLGTQNVFAAARLAGVRRVVHVSSIVAIGAGRGQLLDEQSPWNLADRGVPYVDSKRAAEEWILRQAGSPEVVVVNPGSIVGPEDFTGSEFGILCQRFWRGRVPFIFGGGNNFVDVRDVADGVLSAAQNGRAKERYILAGENQTYTAFFSQLASVANRRIFRMRLPSFAARLATRWSTKRAMKVKKRPRLSAAQARLLGLYFYYDGAKARNELGFVARPLAESLMDAHQFWMGDRSIPFTGSSSLVTRPHVLDESPGLCDGERLSGTASRAATH